MLWPGFRMMFLSRVWLRKKDQRGFFILFVGGGGGRNEARVKANEGKAREGSVLD